MKTLRILLLLAVGAMLVMVVSDYFEAQRAGTAGAVVEPAEIPQNLDSKASRWTWSQTSANERKVEIHADTVEQIRDTTLLRLEGVELLIYRKDARSYDRIVCDNARFDGDTLYSEDAVTVLLGLTPGDPAGSEKKATKIRSTGVTFQSKSGVASTDRYAEYEFKGGTGHSVGSFYDSVHRYFRMNSDAYVERRAAKPGQPPLKIRAGELSYYETEQRVDLKQGASLERGDQQLQAAEASVYLDKDVIRRITAKEATGADRQVSRTVRFETPRMEALYSDKQVLEHITGLGESRMNSESDSSLIKARGKRIDLQYETPQGAAESLLRDMHVRESAYLEASPGPGSPASHGEIRRVSSEILHLRMANGGEDIEFVETLARGRLDLSPLEPTGSRKVLEADRIKMFYGPDNRMDKLQATGDVALERQPPQAGGKPGQEALALRTYSGGLLGEFDPGSGEMRTLRQWADFRFEQGERKGRAGEAQFDLSANSIEMKNQAQVWDPTSRTSAHQLTLDEDSGDFIAQGSVSSVYREKAAADSGATKDLFSTAEPVYATSERMVSNQRSGLLEYHGKARLWQDVDRVEAEHIRIERRQKKLTAEGNVLSVMAEQDNGAAAGKADAASPQGNRRVEVRADNMRYDEESRKVEYRGHVSLDRAALRVKAKELDAWLAPAGSNEDRLRKSEARGAVEIVEKASSGLGARHGFGERAEYHPEAQKVILEGEPARVISDRQDTTQGAALTYYLNDDRLLVLGTPQERSYSLRRKRQSQSAVQP